MTKIDPVVLVKSGNTKQISPAKRWSFTFNNYIKSDMENIIRIFSSNSSKYIIGEEIGESGTPHLQGYVEFTNKVRPLSLIAINKIHWELSKGSAEDNYKYCSKDNKFISIGFPKPLKVLDDKLLKDWQLSILDIIKIEPDDRKIYWYWEPDGNMGKTTFCKYLSIKHKAVPIEGKKNDILYCAAMFESEIYVMDIERSMEEYISYGAIEKIKNGYYMCSKYESKPIIRNSPHLFIFANFEPDQTTLSADRWIVRRIPNNSIN